ncbi:regulation of nuclear pre-mRNA domain-containing protein 1A isoform X7 [Hemicordylus capensis]|uniref:regulation of nuclear pre-mRNA domain-containing protein 1A isoform X7 n=1 Tax=Hemicordylus capensis TaxID=884348 RepID=UPI0023035C3F|nr:regulation of nuclear pre-mRNA domain-containing protein 1A isoform X7 [Hemicordylus capensis]
MSAFSESALERKLSELSNSQQSVQTLSLWLIHHRKHSPLIVTVWERELRKVRLMRVVRSTLVECSLFGKKDGERNARKRTYEQIKVEDNNCSAPSSPCDPPQTSDLIRALQELENAASGDAAVHQRIASLPVEVQDVSLLDRITDKESGEQLSKMVDDACMLLADYNGRLAAEIDDRKQLTRMLSDFLRCQKEVLTEKEQTLEEYKHKLARVSQVRKELKSRIQSLPDLSRLPNVTGSQVHLPFAGDVYTDD